MAEKDEKQGSRQLEAHLLPAESVVRFLAEWDIDAQAEWWKLAAARRVELLQDPAARAAFWEGLLEQAQQKEREARRERYRQAGEDVLAHLAAAEAQQGLPASSRYCSACLESCEGEPGQRPRGCRLEHSVVIDPAAEIGRLVAKAEAEGQEWMAFQQDLAVVMRRVGWLKNGRKDPGLSCVRVDGWYVIPRPPVGLALHREGQAD